MADRFRQLVTRPWVIAIAVVVLVGGGLLGWRYFASRETTDDAQMNGHVSPVAARVSGAVIAVHVNDNQLVKAGDLLVEIDPHDYQIAVARAEADLAAAQASARAARTGVPIATTTTTSQLDVAQSKTGNSEAALHAAEHEVDAARAQLAVAKAHVAEATANETKLAQDLERLKPLVAKDEIPKQQFDAAVANEQSGRAAVESAQASVTAAASNVEVAEAKRVQAAGALTQSQAEAKAAATAPEQVQLTEAQAANADARVQQAQAALDQAKLDLQRTRVVAPVSGIVSRKTVELGQLVQAGQPLLAVASLEDVWVVANFKETQLEHMHPGQAAKVSVDALGRSFTGHVDSISAATGATFSLLPPDNASGNFVKVVQRVPVKIVLDHAAESSGLRPGLSVTATVFVR